MIPRNTSFSIGLQYLVLSFQSCQAFIITSALGLPATVCAVSSFL